MMKVLRTICINICIKRGIHFPNFRRNQVNGDSTRNKKLKLQHKVAAKVPFRRLQSVSPTVQIIYLFLFIFISRTTKFKSDYKRGQ